MKKRYFKSEHCLHDTIESLNIATLDFIDFLIGDINMYSCLMKTYKP